MQQYLERTVKESCVCRWQDSWSTVNHHNAVQSAVTCSHCTSLHAPPTIGYNSSIS